MTKANIEQGVSLLIAAIFSAFFGLASIASAEVASIVNTGPDSNNQITSNHETNCSVDNNNDISASSSNHQYARSGDATVSHNTNSSGWGNLDPGLWQSKGYSHAQWQAAVNAYVASMAADWGNNAGGGGASTGDASNYNSVNTEISVDNSGACGLGEGHHHNGEEEGDEEEQAAGESPSLEEVNAAIANLLAGGAGGAGGGAGSADLELLLAAGGAGNGAGFQFLGSATTSGGAGGAGGGAGGGGAGGGFGSVSVISNTGPDSNNEIESNFTSNTSVVNNNNLSSSSWNNQTATTGDADVNHNTNAGGGSTGDGTNGNTVWSGFVVTN